MSIVVSDVWTQTNVISRSARAVSRPWPRTARTFVWTIVLLIGAEGGLRIRAWVRHGSAGPVAGIYEGDSTLGRRLKPGAAMSGSDRRVTINDNGFRGAKVSESKPEGVVRIAALGDSTTFGMEVSGDDAVWPARLAAALNATVAARFDSINAAVPGYTSAMSLERLRRDVEPFDPDIVIVLQSATDIAAHGRRQFRVIGESAGASLETRMGKALQEHSLLVNLIRQNAAPYLARFAPQRRFDRLDDRGVNEFEATLIAIAEECSRSSRRLVLCTMPRSFGDESVRADQFDLAGTALANNPSLSLAGLNDAYDRYNAAIRSVAARSGATLVDLARLIPRGNAYFVDATHLNDAGHALVAELVASRLSAGLQQERSAVWRLEGRGVPAGHRENSPAIHGWDDRRSATRVP